MDQELKRRLEAGLGDMAPDISDQILKQKIQPIASEAELFGEETEAANITKMPPKRRTARKRIYRTVASLAAVFALLFCFHGVMDSSTIEGQIIVDVNPSISLAVNKRGRVQNVEALNEDGAAIVDGLDKKRGTVDDVLAGVFDSLETQEYLQSEKAGVLVSYCYEQESADVETKIQSAIVSLSGNKQNCTIFSQTFAKEEVEEEEAKTAGVSVGKYYFVNRIREDSSVLEELSYDKTMEELVELMGDKGVQVAGVEVYVGGSGGSDNTGTENANVSVETTEVVGDGSGTANPTESTEVLAQNTKNTQNTQDTQNTQSTESAAQAASSTESSSQSTQNSEAASTSSGTAANTEPSTQQPAVDVSGLKLSWVTAWLGDDNRVHVEWNSLKEASGYDIYYRSSGSTNFEKIAEGVTGTTCVVSGLTPGRSYFFKVVPYLTAGGERYYGKEQISSEVEIPLEPIEEPQPEPTEEPESQTTEDAKEEATETSGEE